MESKFKCPLLKRIIDEGYCYDINMIRTNMMKENIIEDKINKKKATKICSNCKYNPIKKYWKIAKKQKNIEKINKNVKGDKSNEEFYTENCKEDKTLDRKEKGKYRSLVVGRKSLNNEKI